MLAAFVADQDGRLHPLAVAVDEAAAALAQAVEAYQAAATDEFSSSPRSFEYRARREWLANAHKTVTSVLCSRPVLAKLIGKNLTRDSSLAAFHPVSETPTELDRPRGLQDFLRPASKV